MRNLKGNWTVLNRGDCEASPDWHSNGRDLIEIESDFGCLNLTVAMMNNNEEDFKAVERANLIAAAGTSASLVKEMGYDGQLAIENLGDIITILEAIFKDNWSANQLVGGILDKLKQKEEK